MIGNWRSGGMYAFSSLRNKQAHVQTKSLKADSRQLNQSLYSNWRVQTEDSFFPTGGTPLHGAQPSCREENKKKFYQESSLLLQG